MAMTATPAASRQSPAAQQPAKPQTDQQRGAAALAEILDRTTEYTPFMGKEPIKLSQRLVMQFLCTPTRSGAVCDERMATRFVMLCKARGLNPWEGDAYIVGYDSKDGPTFSLVTAHQAFLKRAEVHPEYDGMTSGVLVKRDGELLELEGDWFDEGDTLVGGWATVHFKNRKHPMTKKLKLSTFHQGRSRWNADPAGMIVKCAESDALRSAFPNSLGGMYLDGEMPGPECITAPAVPAGPPVGTNIRLGNGKAPRIEPPAPPPAEPVQPENQPQTEAELSSEDEMARRDMIDDFMEKIGDARTDKELSAVSAELARHHQFLGTETCDMLIEKMRVRTQEIKK